MIVRDIGDAWQVVLQTDHAALSGDFARAWGNERFDTPRPLGTVATAAARHDDGWAIWERAPSVLATDEGVIRPRNFLDVQIRSHLAFYRAQIAAVGDENAHAGLLISMHGCGIYNGRYGTDPGLKLTFAPADRRAVDGFVNEQEQRREELVDELALTEDELWTNYRLVQIYDRLSLHFCMKDMEAGESATLAPVPVTYGGEETEMRIEPDGPWRVRLDPYPFGDAPVTFPLLRRVIAKEAWADNDTFREAFFAAPIQETPIVMSPA
ncbi:MAG: hypothetical protein JWN65_814 [Solirubrobacterales bacterium]|jgi:hypothetical protein|nr:hypothetical protein [Solirubrobacterales bacterium]